MSQSSSAATSGHLAEVVATAVDPFADSERIAALRRDIRALCMQFPDAYWRDLDRRREYPEAFVQALTEAGWLAALIPTAYGGHGFGLQETAAILQEINQSGGYAGPGSLGGTAASMPMCFQPLAVRCSRYWQFQLLLTEPSAR